MTVFPVIVRELRAQARQPSAYWLRIAAAAAAVAIFGVLLAIRDWNESWAVAQATTKRGVNPFSGFGAVLFGHLNATIFVCNCLLAPLLTADCISREKRDGTLGLLFLTPLKPGGIVIGKAFVHALRGFSMFAAVLPMLAVPLLLGGVSGRDCFMALIIDAIVLLLGLAAGFLASAFSRDWIRSLIFAEFLNLVLVLLFMCCHFETVHARIVSLTSFDRGSSPLEYFVGLLWFHTNFAESPGPYSGSTVTSAWTEIWASMTTVGSECSPSSPLFWRSRPFSSSLPSSSPPTRYAGRGARNHRPLPSANCSVP